MSRSSSHHAESGATHSGVENARHRRAARRKSCQRHGGERRICGHLQDAGDGDEPPVRQRRPSEFTADGDETKTADSRHDITEAREPYRWHGRHADLDGGPARCPHDDQEDKE